MPSSTAVSICTAAADPVSNPLPLFRPSSRVRLLGVAAHFVSCHVVLCEKRHLRPSALSTLTRPSVLITDAHNALTDGQSRKEREARLISTIMDTVRGGGNVLLPTDTAGALCTYFISGVSLLLLLVLLRRRRRRCGWWRRVRSRC